MPDYDDGVRKVGRNGESGQDYRAPRTGVDTPTISDPSQVEVGCLVKTGFSTPSGHELRAYGTAVARVGEGVATGIA
jgi:hypothetical protein